MKSNIGVFLSGIIALFVLSCGGPKSSNAVPQTEQKTVQDTTKIANDTVNSENANTTTTATPAKRVYYFPIGIFIVIAIGCGGGVCVVAWLMKEVIGIKKRIEEIEERRVRDRGDIKNLFKLIEDVNKKSSRPYTEQIINPVQDNKPPLVQKKDDTPPVQVSDSPMPTEQPPRKDSEHQFLDHYGNGNLKVVKFKDQANYQVYFSIGQSVGHFEFVGDAIKAIKNKAIIDGVCEANNYNLHATHIHTDKWGTCVRQVDGTWKVTEKAVISYN